MRQMRMVIPKKVAVVQDRSGVAAGSGEAADAAGAAKETSRAEAAAMAVTLSFFMKFPPLRKSLLHLQLALCIIVIASTAVWGCNGL